MYAYNTTDWSMLSGSSMELEDTEVRLSATLLWLALTPVFWPPTPTGLLLFVMTCRELPPIPYPPILYKHEH